jgi:uncharacterized protein (DUF305 family)
MSVERDHSGTRGVRRRYAALVALLVGVGSAACSGTAGQSAATAPAPQAKPESPKSIYTAADVHFMSGMIHHHAQALLMAGWAPTHDASQSIRTLCERIVVGQGDEIALMQRWLRDRHEAVPAADASHDMMPGMDQSTMMPGMLTPEQLAQLDHAKGPEFDRLFLTSMIEHHRGALTMVDQLFASQGAGEEETVFRFASDVYADQSTEIDRMQRMLAALGLEGHGP